MTAPPDTARKADARRADLVARIADHLLANGLATASLRPLAAAAGVSDRMLLYYFPDKAAVIGSALDLIAARIQEGLAAQVAPVRLPPAALEPRLLAMAADPAVWPALRLWLDIAARAAWGEAPYGAAGERIGRLFVAWIAAQVDAPDPAAAALDLLRTVEGAVVLRAVGLLPGAPGSG